MNTILDLFGNEIFSSRHWDEPTQAYVEGFVYGTTHYDRECDCPYNLSSQESVDWRAGYWDAQND